MRKQVTVQVHKDRHPHLYERYFDENGDRIKRYNAAEEIPIYANQAISGDVEKENAVIEKLNKIEDMISSLRNVGVIDDDQEIELKERANDLINLIPIME